MVVVLIWALVGLVIALYILFIVWRVRVDRRNKAMQQNNESTVPGTIARAGSSLLSTAPPPPATAAMVAPAATPSSSPVAATVAEALAGISLPDDLAPLTTMAPRGGIGDRVAFWTKVPAEVVGPAFGDELERLGYAVSSIDTHTLAAQRADARLVALIHPDAHRATIGDRAAFDSVPELATVVEVWIPL